MVTLHVHNKFGEPTPSPGDVKAARLWGEMIYVESRTGLYSVGPDGTVYHLFNARDWFRKKVCELIVVARREILQSRSAMDGQGTDPFFHFRHGHPVQGI